MATPSDRYNVVLPQAVHAAAIIPKAIAGSIASRPIVYAGSSLVWLTSSTLQKMCKIVRWSVEKAEKGEWLKKAAPHLKEATRTLQQRQIDLREARGQQTQAAAGWVQTGLKTASLLPFVGGAFRAAEMVTDAGVQALKKLEEIERAIENGNRKVWMENMPTILDLFAHTSPYALQALSWALSKGESGMETLLKIAETGMEHPEALEEWLTRGADQLDGAAYRLAGFCSIEEGAAPKAAILLPEVTPAEIVEFNGRSPVEKEDIRFLVQESTVWKQAGKTKEAAPQDARELLRYWKALSEKERLKVTPRIFRNYDANTKVQLLRLVEREAHGLSSQERRLLLQPEYRMLRNGNDWEKLTEGQKLAIERLIVSSFNELPPKVQSHIYDITAEEFAELHPEEFQKILNVIKVRVKTDAEKMRLQAIEKKKAPLSLTELRALVKMFRDHMNPAEKSFLASSIRNKVQVVQLLPQEMDALIQAQTNPQIKAFLEAQRAAMNAPTPAPVSLVAPILAPAAPKAMPKSVTTAAPVTTAPKPVDMRTIQAAVGAHVVSPTMLTKAFSGFGTILGRAENLIDPQPYLYRGAAYSAEKLVEPSMNALAKAVDVASAIPGVHAFLRSGLIQAGIPVDKMDEMLLQAPQMVTDAFLSGIQMAIRAATGAVGSADSFVKQLIQVRDHLEKAADLQKQEALVATLSSQVKVQAGLLTELSAAMCEANTGALLKMCAPEVRAYLTDASTWDALSKQLGVAKESAEFMQAIEMMARTGKMVTKESLQGSSSALVALSDAVTTNAARAAASVSQAMGASWGFLKSKMGSLQHAEDAVRQSPIGGAARLATQGAEAVALGVQQAVQVGRGLATKALQAPLPPVTEALIAGYTKQRSDLAAAGAKVAICQQAALAIGELQKTALGALAVAAADNTYAKAALDAADNYFCQLVVPTMQTGLQYLSSVQAAAMASHEFLKESNAAQAAIELQLENFSKKQFEMASGVLSSGATADKSKLVGKYVSALSTVMTAGLAATGQLSIVVPFLTANVVPHLLREAGRAFGKEAVPFWTNLAADSEAAKGAIVQQRERLFGTLGKALQGTINYIAGGVGYIDPQRMKQFRELPASDAHHLIDLARQAKSLGEKEKTRLQALQEKYPDRVTVEERDELIKMTLTTYDKLSRSELIAMSPTAYKSLDQRFQARVKGIVERHVGLKEVERNNPDAIVAKFNGLDEKQRKELDDMAVWEYSELSDDEQSDMRFIVANSSAFRDVGMVRLKREAAREHGRVGAILTEELDGEPELDVDFGLTEYHKMAGMSNRELERVLHLYTAIPDSERAILTPSQLKRMSKAKVLHCFELVKKYHPELIQEFYTSTKLNLNSLEKTFDAQPHELIILKQRDRLLEVLAAAFMQLPKHEQALFLEMTKEEIQAFDPKDKALLLDFLVTRSELQKMKEALQKERIQLANGKPLNEALIQSAFQGLKKSDKAEFRTMQKLNDAAIRQVKSEFEVQLDQLNDQIRYAQAKLDRLRDVEFFTKKIELDEAVKKGDAKKAEAARAALRPIAEKILKAEVILGELQQKKKGIDIVLPSLSHMLDATKKVETVLDPAAEMQSAEARAIEAGWKAAVGAILDKQKEVMVQQVYDNAIDDKILTPVVNTLLTNLQMNIAVVDQKVKALNDEIAALEKEISKEGLQPEERVAKKEQVRLILRFYLPLYQVAKQHYDGIVQAVQNKAKEERESFTKPGYSRDERLQTRNMQAQFRL